ncbi:MAG TPA: hypothetical protein VFY03_11655, partial [Woeseiaceae bacterium]|nr:hypothetical protein [Woeseiaceae bacterium]
MNASEPVSRTGCAALGAAIVAALLLWAPGLPAQEPMADPSELDEDDEAWERESAADEGDDAAPGRDPCGREEMPDAVPAPGPSPLSEDDDMPATIPGPGPSPLSEDDDTPVEEPGPGPSPLDEDDDPPP